MRAGGRLPYWCLLVRLCHPKTNRMHSKQKVKQGEGIVEDQAKVKGKISKDLSLSKAKLNRNTKRICAVYFVCAA